MKLALQLLDSQYALLGAPPVMWGQEGWFESYITDPSSPDFFVFENSSLCMEYATYYVVGSAPPGTSVRIVTLPNFTATTFPGRSTMSRMGSLQFGVRDSTDANLYATSLAAYNGGEAVLFSSFGQFRDVSANFFGDAITVNCPSGAIPDILIFYS